MFTSPAQRRRNVSVRRQFLSIAIVASMLAVLLPTRFAPVVTPTAEAVSTTIVISQVYGGGGNSGATYTHDFIELFNLGTSPQSLNGWSVQYTSAAGTSWSVTNLTNVTLQPGQYYLIQEAQGAGGTTPLPTPDATGTIAMSANNGKVALVNTTTPLSGSGCPFSASVVDFVGYGTANCSETAAAPALTNTTADIRAANGCTDTDNNSTDFATGAPTPRNTSTTLAPCGGGSPTLSINDVTQAEGSGGGTTNFTFTVTMSPANPTQTVTVNYATADGTTNPATGGADCTTPGNDYITTSGMLTFSANDTSEQITVQVCADNNSEPNETFFVNLSGASNATIGDGQGLGTINDDDITLMLISQVQGSGAASPFAGSSVTVRGIVTLLKSNGFFLQEEVGDNDSDPNTSEGVFVFTSSAPTVAVGDQATVTGTVVEFNGLTEITTPSVSVNSTGNTLPTAVTIDATILSPTAPFDQSNLEKYEGMRMSAAALRSVSPNDSFFDIETVLPAVPREQVFREPGIPAADPVPPDPTSGTPDCCIPIWDMNPEKLNLDTNGRAGATGVAYTSNITFSNVAGPLDFSFGRYRLIPEAGFTASTNISATPAPTPTASEFTVVGYNIENFNNNATQRQKAADTIRTILHYPDIIGTVEIFDLADLQALRDEINNDAVAAGHPNPMYEAYLVEQDGTSEDSDQDVGYLVKTARVSVTSVTQEREEVTYPEPGGGNPAAILHDRPPLVLDAIVDPSGANPRRVIVVVNHTRSFIDIEMVAGDGPRVREKRKKQAEDIADLLNDLQTANPGVPVIAVGDYNAFQFNNGYDDPVSVLKGNPTPDDQIVVDQSPDLVNPDFFNLIELVPAAERYSFFFDDDGAMQVLDHVLVNTAARQRNTRIAIAHVNVDFPGSPAATYASNVSRVEHNSDHDPVIAYFTLNQPQPAGTLIISEYRLRGPGPIVNTESPNKVAGSYRRFQLNLNRATIPTPNVPDLSIEANDEFIEFYNNTDSPITVATTDGSAGWALTASDDGVTRFVIPNGTVIPARGHYLAVNSTGYSLSGYPAGNNGSSDTTATGDISYSLNINDGSGIALFNTANSVFFTEDNRLDAVGYSANPALYREGAGFSGAPGPEIGGNIEYSFFRDLRSGHHRDTNDNAADFMAADTSGTGTTIGTNLGAPGPENLSSPVVRFTRLINISLLDPAASANAPPNRVRSNTPPVTNGANGTISIRRRITNNTGAPVTRLRFRVIEVTTFRSPPIAGQADVRVLSSSDINVTLTDSSIVPVQGLTLEEPPLQPSGGGWNSTVSVGTISLSSPLNHGVSINVHFLLGVQTNGSFRFFVNTEALP